MQKYDASKILLSDYVSIDADDTAIDLVKYFSFASAKECMYDKECNLHDYSALVRQNQEWEGRNICAKKCNLNQLFL